MSQNRPPPAFQEYAASMLSNMTFRMMSLSGRGLLYTLRLEYWIGNPLPSDSEKLSKVLGLKNSEVASAIKELGELISVEQGFIRIHELDDYRSHLDDQRRKKSEGGKEGARRARNLADEKKQLLQNKEQSSGDPELSQGSTSGVLVKHMRVQTNLNQISQVNNEEHSEWIDEYERTRIKSQ